MRTTFLVTKAWLGTVDDVDRSFGQEMLAKFFGQLVGTEPRPSAICFYTEGVKAALADTPFHAALVSLEAAGVPLLLCGTCLDHYGIAEKTVVGTVADMRTIAAALSNADKVITI